MREAQGLTDFGKKVKGRAAPRVSYLFTTNNYSAKEVEALEKFAELHCKYMIFGFEVGEEGTPHLQGYLILKKKARLTFIRKFLEKELKGPCKTFPLARKPDGSPAECRAYSLKIRPEDKEPNERWFEHGVCPKYASDGGSAMRATFELAKEGGLRAVFEDEDLAPQIIRYHSGIRQVAQLSMKERNFKTHVTVIIGPTGTGKSAAAAKWPNSAVVNPPRQGETMYFDPYDTHVHDTLWLDDFKSSSSYRYSDLLKLMDRNKMSLNVKYGSMQMRAKYLVITSSQPPKQWYPDLFEKYPAQYAELERRLDVVIVTKGLGDYTFKRGTAADLPCALPVPEDMSPPPPPINWDDAPVVPAVPAAVQAPVASPPQVAPLFSTTMTYRDRLLQHHNIVQRAAAAVSSVAFRAYRYPKSQ